MTSSKDLKQVINEIKKFDLKTNYARATIECGIFG